MTVSQIRRRLNILKRKFAPELAIIKLRRIAESVADHWNPDGTSRSPPTSSHSSLMPASDCPPSSGSAATWRTPDARATSLSLRPSSSTCSPGPGKTATAHSSAGTFPPLRASHALNPVYTDHRKALVPSGSPVVPSNGWC